MSDILGRLRPLYRLLLDEGSWDEFQALMRDSMETNSSVSLVAAVCIMVLPTTQLIRKLSYTCRVVCLVLRAQRLKSTNAVSRLWPG